MNTENINVVFDTNIYISAVLFGGLPGEVYSSAIKGYFILSVSTDILKEIEGCLLEKFFGMLPEFRILLDKLKE